MGRTDSGPGIRNFGRRGAAPEDDARCRRLRDRVGAARVVVAVPRRGDRHAAVPDSRSVRLDAISGEHRRQCSREHSAQLPANVDE